MRVAAFVASTLGGWRALAPSEQFALYALCLGRVSTEAVILAFVVVLHACLLPFNIVQVSDLPDAADFAAFLIVDGCQFVVIAMLARILMTHGKRAAVLAANQRLLAMSRIPPHSIDAVENPVPWAFKSGCHEVLVLAAMCLSASRLAIVDTVICINTAQSKVSYRPCEVYNIGGFPFPAMGLCIVTCFVFLVLLAENIGRAFVGLTIAYGASYAMWLTTNYITLGPSPQPFDVVMVSIITLVAAGSTLYAAYRVLHEWKQSRKLMRLAAELASSQENAIRLRERVCNRLKLARQVGYERALAFAAHKLRNPLHAILAVMEMDGKLLRDAVQRTVSVGAMRALSPRSTSALLITLGHDVESAYSSAGAMQRIIADIADFFMLREGSLHIVPTVTFLSEMFENTAMVAASLAGSCAWRGYVLDAALGNVVIVDGKRLEQLLIDCVSHAVSRGCTKLEAATLLLLRDDVDGQTERGPTHGRDSGGTAVPPLSASPISLRHLSASLSDDAVTLPVRGGEAADMCACAHSRRNSDTLDDAVRSTGPLAALVLRALGLQLVESEAELFDPVHLNADVRLAEQSPVESSLREASPMDDEYPMGIRREVLCASLSTAVAQLLVRRMGGDLTIFSMPCSAQCTAPSDTWYLAVFPATRVEKQGCAPPVWHLGGPRKCERCGREVSVEGTPLFGHGATLHPNAQEQLRRALCDLALAVFNQQVCVPVGPATPTTVVPLTSTAAVGPTQLRVEAQPSLRNELPVNRVIVPALPVHVLYADDEAINRKLLGRMIGSLGGTMEAVDDGDQVVAALQRAGMLTAVQLAALRAAGLPLVDGAPQERPSAATANRPFDVIVLDIVMKRSDGVEVCKALRHVLPPPFPIIAATGNARDPGRLHAAGFTLVIEKPFSVLQLRRALQLPEAP